MNYNKEALRGNKDYTDYDFARDMAEAGIHIPEDYVGTDRMVPWVHNQIYKNNIEHFMTQEHPSNPGRKYTESEAQQKAEGLRREAEASYAELMKANKN